MISKVKPVVHDDNEKIDWYESWFDSPYYHILYKDRDQREAELLLENLISFIKPPPEARILDVACGKGRHSIYLNKKGFDVTGFDLSAKSIEYDKQFENEKLSFDLHDMREVFRSNYFDIVLNLFSSFGYFQNERDNIRCLIANAIALKPNGIFVFDYFNSNKITKNDCSPIHKLIDGINFHIEKKISGKFILKKISFSENNKSYLFEEQLLLADKKDFEKYFSLAGMTITGCYGNYLLEPFNENTSDRLIIIAKKRNE